MDKFYTKQEVVKRCLDEINKLPYKYDCVIEPSAGDGAFYKNIEHDTKIGIDIDPQHDEIIEGDWFNYNINEAYECVLVIGNPPFGQYQSYLQNLYRTPSHLAISKQYIKCHEPNRTEMLPAETVEEV